MKRLSIIDSHTGGEPTRIVIAGAPDLGPGDMASRLARLRDEQDWLRGATVLEPRGSDVIVGALLCEPVDPACAAGVIFFNNVGYLGMCGHGTIGLVATLAHLGRITAGTHRIETPVGEVTATLHENGDVSVGNVRSYRLAKSVPLDVPGYGRLHGDIAWGGNWFFLVDDHGLSVDLAHLAELDACAKQIRRALDAQGITGADGQVIDHVELFGPSTQADSRNFVLCPGGAYDRSPCGTGTSAKLACLAADGKLAPGDHFRQESIVGSVFTGSYSAEEGGIRPTIRGTAFVTAEATLLLDPRDPFCHGLGQ
ncbi:MAG: 4-hydroxyproline epimerase [Bryobacteraceae bacterium]|nr:4-hydroxyproline epimerase [Bryobacteraceae bacterium]